MLHGTFSRNTRAQLKQVFDALRVLMTPPEPRKRPIGFITPEDKKDGKPGSAKAKPTGKKAERTSTLRLKEETTCLPQSYRWREAGGFSVLVNQPIVRRRIAEPQRSEWPTLGPTIAHRTTSPSGHPNKFATTPLRPREAVHQSPFQECLLLSNLFLRSLGNAGM